MAEFISRTETRKNTAFVENEESETKRKLEDKVESQNEEILARRRRLSSGGLLRRSQKLTKRPPLARSHTLDTLFSSRTKKISSTRDNQLSDESESCETSLQRQNSRERRHSTPTDLSQKSLASESEPNFDLMQVFHCQTSVRDKLKLHKKKRKLQTNMISEGNSHKQVSNVYNMKPDPNHLVKNDDPLTKHDRVHDLSFELGSAAVANEKEFETQLISHDIFSRNTQSRNPVRREKQSRRKSLPALPTNDSSRKTFANWVQSQERLENSKVTKNLEGYSNYSLKEITKASNTSKGLISSFLEGFLEQKEIGDVNVNEESVICNQEKLYRESESSSSRRFSLPSRLQDVYVGQSEYNKEITGIIKKFQDFEGQFSKIETNVAQQENEPRKKSLPEVSKHFFSESDNCLELFASNLTKKTKSLPGLTKLSIGEMEDELENKVIFRPSSANSLNIERPTQVSDERTKGEINNELGVNSELDSLTFDVKSSINKSPTSDLDNEMLEVTRCVDNVIQAFYKHKEQCGHTITRYSHKNSTNTKIGSCTNTSDLNSTGTFLELHHDLENEVLMGLETLPKTTADQEIYVRKPMPSSEFEQDIPHERVNKDLVTKIEKSPEISASIEDNTSLEQNTSFINDCELSRTNEQYSTPVELHEYEDNGLVLLRKGELKTEIKEGMLDSAAKEQQKKLSEEKPHVTSNASIVSNSENTLDGIMKENVTFSNGHVEQALTINEELLDVDQTYNYSLLDLPVVENIKEIDEDVVVSNEKSEVEMSNFAKNNEFSGFVYGQNGLNSDKHECTSVKLSIENLGEQSVKVLPNQEREIVSEKTQMTKPAEKKSKYVQNPSVIVYSVIQSVLEELFFQAQTQNSKTDVTTVRDNVSSATIKENAVESALSHNNNEHFVAKIDQADGGLFSDTKQTQDDLCHPLSDSENESKTGGNNFVASCSSYMKNEMIISKDSKEAGEKEKQLENKETEDKIIMDNKMFMSLQNYDNLDSESLKINPEETNSEEFEHEVDRILESVTAFNDDNLVFNTSDSSLKQERLQNEHEDFANTTYILNDNVRAEKEGLDCNYIHPVENGKIESIVTQHELCNTYSELLELKNENEEKTENFPSAKKLELNEQIKCENSKIEEVCEIKHLSLQNVADEMQNPENSEHFFRCEKVINEISMNDNQCVNEPEIAEIENESDNSDTVPFQGGLDESMSSKVVDLGSSDGTSKMNDSTEFSQSSNAIKVINNEDIKTCGNEEANFLGFSGEKSSETVKGYLINEMKIPEIVLPCETTESASTEKEIKDEGNIMLRQDLEVEPEKQAHKNILDHDSTNKNIKPLELDFSEGDSENVEICDGSPIESLSQELDAFDISPFSRPRVYTLPLANQMEKIVEAPCEVSPDIEKKEFASVFSRCRSPDMLQLRKTGSLCRDARNRKFGKTKRSFSAPSATIFEGKHKLYPLHEEQEAVELTYDERLKLFEKLLSRSLKTVLEPDFTRSKSPLHRAIAKERFDCVEFLIECGVDINANDESGWPPLHVAVTRGCFDCAVLLVEAGADLGEYTELVMNEYQRLRREIYCRTI